MSSYLNPKVHVADSRNGKGVFAIQHVSKGEVIADYMNGTGRYIGEKEAARLYDQGKDYFLQVDEGRYFAAVTDDEVENADFINHSCNPNCGLSGPLTIVAMRDIVPGEEITFDYAMSESSKYEMKCNCGSDDCRKLITGEDWKIPELQKKYSGFFTPYLKKKISEIKKE